MRRPGRISGVVLAAGLLVVAGCARAGGPPGGVPDETPPQVLNTAPDTFAILDDPPPQVTIFFDERISERPAEGTMDDAVIISPQTGSVRVRHQRQSVEVSMVGGFQPGIVYQVTLRPILNDMFRNALEEPFEFFFSTGAEFHPNVLAGFVSDRLTGEPVAGARVDARPEGDTLVHATETDDEGLFSLRYIPPGPYEIVAYEDRNRNRNPEFEEPQDSTFATVGPADTVVVLDLAVLQPDTTPSDLASAGVADSVSVRLTFSDYLDPTVPLDEASVTLSREDGGAVPEVERILHAHEFEAVLRDEAAAADTAAGPAAPQAPPLPSRDIMLRLAEALEPGVTYQVEVSGVPNIAGVPGGGGEAEFTRPEPPPDPPPEPPPGGDTIRGDTLPPDSLPGSRPGSPPPWISPAPT